MKEKQRESGSDAAWDWLRFEEWMGRVFPFLKDELDMGRHMRVPFAVGKMVQETLDRAFRGISANRPLVTGFARIDVFETHRNLIARVFLPAGVRSDQVRTLVGSHRLRVEWPPGERREVTLNRPVNPRRSRAVIKNGILEIRMPKVEERFHEL